MRILAGGGTAGQRTGETVAGATAGLSQRERQTVRYHLGCLATLLPHHQRPAALEAWLDIDRALFHLGFHAPRPVSESVLCLGGTRLRAALAGAVGDHDTQRALLALDIPEVDAALVIERGQLSAFEVAPLVRPAGLLTSWVGQGSGWGSVSHAAWSGRAALHVETAALLARWTAGGVPADRWAAFHSRLWRYPGSLPELLAEVSAAHPDPAEPPDAGPGAITA
ncbi:hypothetical protein ACIQZO_18635 [Streptomyces sp. NPDC097617]|uniref:hypothetical protein n=1 Tax=Streptomyces sp. NPDC097617 TaxID=3366091 RepID=UPI003816F3DF